MSTADYIDSYLKYMKEVQGYSDKTVVSYRHDLERLEAFLSSHNIELPDMVFEDAREFTTLLYEEGLSGATINRILSANRSFFKHLNENCVTGAQPFVRVKRAKQGQRIPTVLSEDELNMILNYPYDDYTSLTEVTMFNLFYSTGCRLSEILGMKADDINLETRKVLVTGKGAKQRYVFLTPKTVEILDVYLKARKDLISENGFEDPQLLLINKKGNPLPISTVHSIFDKYRDKLGIVKKFTPHVFRHTFATDMLDGNLDIRVVQALLGHENIGTTQIYTHVTSSKLENVYRSAHPHGRKK